MTPERPDFDLPEGWTCWVELTQAPEGTFGGKAELRQGRVQRCVFVLAQQPTREAALERVKFRARHFVDEWASRPKVE
uniref:hypothetical protein n=1 Tax=unclassified Variovorax TaxID=663243 RepID=UPI000D37E1C0